jgi:hypothetical protein
MHRLANEPTIGLYRVTEHVRRAVPQLQSRKVCQTIYSDQTV